MSELDLLRLLLLVSMAIGPLGTHRAQSRYSPGLHAAALACAAIGLFTSASFLTTGWLLFTATSFGLFLYLRRATLLSRQALAACVPFLFSNIAALWVVGGSNNLHILGYEVHFSYYAALHGNVLGWITLGAIAILAERDPSRRGLYVAVVFVCLASFLSIAFGIDQLRPLKTIGIVGLSLALPFAVLVFLRSVWTTDRRAFVLGCVSLAGLIGTMLLAWRNELFVSFSLIGGIREMVSIHGLLNTLVVAPCLLFAATRTHPRPGAGRGGARSLERSA